jgi:hypothetical protein
VQSVRPTSARHSSACKLINNYNLTVTNNILLVTLVEGVCYERLVEAVEDLHIGGIEKVPVSEKALGLLDAA